MTLIVGKLNKEQRDFRIFSDTRITDEVKKEHSKIFQGVVKSIIYTPQICINYAGSNSSANEIQEILFKINTELNINQLADMLFKFHYHSNQDVSFLIASTSIYNGSGGFIKISDGKQELNPTTSWIGDIDGFNLFQEEFHKFPKKERIQNKLDCAEKAFKNVVLSTKAITVGGVSVIVNWKKDYGFQYKMQAESTLGRDIEIQFEEKNKPVPIDFGSAKEGSFNYSCLVNSKPPTAAIGIYYYDGRFGIFSFPRKERSFVVYKNISADDFVQTILEEHKIQIGGIVSERGTMRFIGYNQ